MNRCIGGNSVCQICADMKAFIFLDYNAENFASYKF